MNQTTLNMTMNNKHCRRTTNVNPYKIEKHKSISVCMMKYSYLKLLTEELTAKEHGQPLCTQKPAYYIHSSLADYVAVLKMPIKS
jgi:hypothetical protein